MTKTAQCENVNPNWLQYKAVNVCNSMCWGS